MKTYPLVMVFALAYNACVAQTPPGAGYALHMDLNDKIDVGNHYSSLNFPFSFSSWIKPDSSGIYPLFASADRSAANQGFWVEINSSFNDAEVFFSFGNGNGYTQNSYKRIIGTLNDPVIRRGRWVHVAIVAKSASDIKIYINGLETTDSIVAGNATTMNGNLSNGLIGYDTLNQKGFFGEIDEVTIWNKALTANEIRLRMCKVLTGSETGLFGYYNFDTPNSFVLHDNSTNSHQGVILGPSSVYSSAPLGEKSNYSYSSSQNVSATIKSLSGDSILAFITTAITDTNGLQVYIVESKPVPRPSGYQIPPAVNFYFGIFIAKHDFPRDLYDVELHLAPPLVQLGVYTVAITANRAPWMVFGGNGGGSTTTNNPVITISDMPIYMTGVIVNRCPTFQILPQDTLACDSVQLSVPSKYDSLQWNDGSTAYTRNIDSSGTYWFTAYDSISDCPATDTIEVTLLSDQTISVLPNDTLLCPGDSLQLDASLPGASGYLWSTGDTTAHLTVKDSGLHSVQINIDSACFAYDSIRVSYSSFSDPVQDSSYVQCESDSVLVQLNPQEWQSASWSNGRTGLQTYFTEGGKYFVTATNHDGCSLSDTFNLEIVSPGDTLPIFPDTTFCLSEPLLLKTPPGFTATWPNGSDSVYTVEETEAIKLLIGNGCEDTSYYFEATMENCSCQVKVPDAFTPNADGLNDIFKPVTECNYLQYELSIFDRWGKKLFHTAETGRGFDGNFKGRKLSGGVYLYRFQYKTEHTAGDLNGYFVLVR